MSERIRPSRGPHSICCPLWEDYETDVFGGPIYAYAIRAFAEKCCQMFGLSMPRGLRRNSVLICKQLNEMLKYVVDIRILDPAAMEAYKSMKKKAQGRYELKYLDESRESFSSAEDVIPCLSKNQPPKNLFDKDFYEFWKNHRE